jgi:hypothetical protein
MPTEAARMHAATHLVVLWILRLSQLSVSEGIVETST